MATSRHFRHNVRSEQNLYEDLIVESLKFFGTDIYYLPREVVARDMIFNDETLSRFAYAYRIEVSKTSKGLTVTEIYSLSLA